MRFTSRRAMQGSLAAGGLLAFVTAFASGAPGERGAARAAPSALSVVHAEPAPKPQAPLSGFNPLSHHERGGRLVSELPGGGHAELTLDARLQRHVTEVLQRYAVPYGALVAIDPRDGRVLAYVSHSSANPAAGDLALDTTPPAASVFKLVTTAALVDRGVGAERAVCYSGGFRKLYRADLQDDPQRDARCATLSEALGGSINTVFAKLADRHLDRATLHRYASAFGFGHALPFDVATRPSPMEVPAERLELARTAAGFWHMHMSPLHGALLASTLANDGVMPRASMVERVVGPGGKILLQRQAADFRAVIPRATARAVGTMMQRTVTHGTARSAFFDDRGNAFLPGIAVAGKTGSLSTDRPYRAYSWWVGYAPVDKPEIALAALVVNSPRWRIKGSYLAREALRHYLVDRPQAPRASAAAAPAAARAKGQSVGDKPHP